MNRPPAPENNPRISGRWARQGDTARLHQPPVERASTASVFRRCDVRFAIRRRTSNPGGCRATRSGISRRARWLGKARRSVRSAPRSRIPRATAIGLRRDNQDENAYCLTQKCSRGQPVASARMLLASLSICTPLVAFIGLIHSGPAVDKQPAGATVKVRRRRAAYPQRRHAPSIPNLHRAKTPRPCSGLRASLRRTQGHSPARAARL